MIFLLEIVIIWFVNVWINWWLCEVKRIELVKVINLLFNVVIDFKFKWFVGLFKIKILVLESINFESMICIFLFLERILIGFSIFLLENNI